MLSRRQWLVVVLVPAAVLLALGFAAWKVYDDVLDLDGCDGPSDVNSGWGPGACGRPFTAADFTDGNARIDAYVRNDEWSQLDIGFSYSNLTDEWRSLDWRKAAVIDPTGAEHRCWGDDSAVQYESDPHSTNRLSYGGCPVPTTEPGVYRMVYDGETVDTIEVS